MRRHVPQQRDYRQADAEADAQLLRAWSLAAGELSPASARERQAPAQGVET